MALIIYYVLFSSISVVLLAFAGVEDLAFYASVTYIVYWIVVIMLIELYVSMSYNRWFYEFTGTELKLERGVIWKRYSNIPYQRIQNVDISRGIIARLCGFSTVHIQTAGYSYSSGTGFGSEGYIPAVDAAEAERIRAFVMKKISERGHSGL